MVYRQLASKKLQNAMRRNLLLPRYNFLTSKMPKAENSKVEPADLIHPVHDVHMKSIEANIYIYKKSHCLYTCTLYQTQITR